MNVVVSDPKTAKAHNVKLENPAFLSKRLGETVDLSSIGLAGFEGVITGGSDKDGFPMKATLTGTARRKLLMRGGVGFHPKRKGQRARKTVRGNMVADDIHQLNVKVTKTGSKSLDDLLGAPKPEAKEGEEEKPASEDSPSGASKKEEESKPEQKEEAPKQEKKEEGKEEPKKEKPEGKKEEKPEEKKKDKPKDKSAEKSEEKPAPEQKEEAPAKQDADAGGKK